MPPMQKSRSFDLAKNIRLNWFDLCRLSKTPALSGVENYGVSQSRVFFRRCRHRSAFQLFKAEYKSIDVVL